MAPAKGEGEKMNTPANRGKKNNCFGRHPKRHLNRNRRAWSGGTDVVKARFVAVSGMEGSPGIRPAKNPREDLSPG